MRAVLSISAPSLVRGMAVTLAGAQVLSIGSSKWADLTINDRTLSGKHLQLSMLSNECWLRDLKSATGTFVNGTRVIATEVCDGDVIQLGETTISVTLTDRNSDTSDLKPPSYGKLSSVV